MFFSVLWKRQMGICLLSKVWLDKENKAKENWHPNLLFFSTAQAFLKKKKHLSILQLNCSGLRVYTPIRGVSRYSRQQKGYWRIGKPPDRANRRVNIWVWLARLLKTPSKCWCCSDFTKCVMKLLFCYLCYGLCVICHVCVTFSYSQVANKSVNAGLKRFCCFFF